MDEIKSFRKVRGKQNSLITLIVYDTSKDELLSYVDKQLDLIKNIKDSFKRKMENEILYKLKCDIENLSEEKVNKIYLVSEDEINNFNLTKKNIHTLREYNKPKIYYKTDERFEINYIIDLFTDFKFYKVLELDKKSGSYFEINSTKKKLIDKKTIGSQSELVDILDSSVNLLHGNSTFLKNLSCNILFFNKRLCDDELLDEVVKIIILENHEKLENLLSNIVNPEYEDKIIFGGSETKKYTELSMISKLYIHESIYKKFMNVFKEYINFEVYEIKKLSHGDVSDKLKNDYDCCIGELYYKKQF